MPSAEHRFDRLPIECRQSGVDQPVERLPPAIPDRIGAGSDVQVEGEVGEAARADGPLG